MSDLGNVPMEFISTGTLPSTEDVSRLVESAFSRFSANDTGALSTVYPALATVDPKLFGISLVSARGHVFQVGDAEVTFPIMSVVKPFVFALVCQAIGPSIIRERVGVNSTGQSFNSVSAIERGPDGMTNPMVNSGAIATISLTPGDTLESRWRSLSTGLSRFAGRDLTLMDDVYKSASESNFRNRSIANLLESMGRLYCDTDEALDLYTKVCSLAVTAHDLAVMGATLADGGRNPLTGQQVVDARVCHYTLAVMTTAGMYETSGDWLYETGLPGKSGIGGGIVTVAPGKGGLGTFAPLLDSAGNSVKGQLATAYLSRALGLGLFGSTSR